MLPRCHCSEQTVRAETDTVNMLLSEGKLLLNPAHSTQAFVCQMLADGGDWLVLEDNNGSFSFPATVN